MANVKNIGNLKCKIKKGYINNPKAQRLLGELCKGKALKEVKLGNILLKYKQSQVCVPQGKLRLVVLKEEHDSSITGYRGFKPTIAAVPRRCYWPCIKDKIAHFVKT